jgi:hypothetical protein
LAVLSELDAHQGSLALPKPQAGRPLPQPLGLSNTVLMITCLNPRLPMLPLLDEPGGLGKLALGSSNIFGTPEADERRIFSSSAHD